MAGGDLSGKATTKFCTVRFYSRIVWLRIGLILDFVRNKCKSLLPFDPLLSRMSTNSKKPTSTSSKTHVTCGNRVHTCTCMSAVDCYSLTL